MSQRRETRHDLWVRGRRCLRGYFWLLGWRPRIINGISWRWRQCAGNWRLRSVITTFCRCSRCRWLAHVFSALSLPICSLCDFDQFVIFARVRLSSVLIFDHGGSLGPHLPRDRSEVGAKVRQIVSKVGRLIDRPVTRHSSGARIGRSRPRSLGRLWRNARIQHRRVCTEVRYFELRRRRQHARVF